MRRFLTEKRPFEFRPVRPIDLQRREKLPPVNHVWIRAVDELPDEFWKNHDWVFRRDNVILPPHAMPQRTVETVAMEYMKDH